MQSCDVLYLYESRTNYMYFCTIVMGIITVLSAPAMNNAPMIDEALKGRNEMAVMRVAVSLYNIATTGRC